MGASHWLAFRLEAKRQLRGRPLTNRRDQTKLHTEPILVVNSEKITAKGHAAVVNTIIVSRAGVIPGAEFLNLFRVVLATGFRQTPHLPRLNSLRRTL